jgi:hypothetical protein
VIRLLILVVVVGAVGLVAYHWYQSNSGGTPSGGYHGAKARHYRLAYRICKRAVSNGKVDLHRLRSLHLTTRFREIELQGCTAGARKAGLGDIVDQLKHSLP